MPDWTMCANAEWCSLRDTCQCSDVVMAPSKSQSWVNFWSKYRDDEDCEYYIEKLPEKSEGNDEDTIDY